MTELNPVTLPAHYQFCEDITEVRDVIRDRTVVYLDNDLPVEGIYDYNNAIKYILRAPAKNGIEDLRKAQYCLGSLISILEADAEATADQPTEYWFGVPALDVAVGDDEDKPLDSFDEDVLADVITRLKNVMNDQKEEMQHNVMKTRVPDPRLLGPTWLLRAGSQPSDE